MMKLDPHDTKESRQEFLSNTAERVYGPERASELADPIEHLARMMTAVAAMELDITDEPLPGPTRRDRGAS